MQTYWMALKVCVRAHAYVCVCVCVFSRANPGRPFGKIIRVRRNRKGGGVPHYVFNVMLQGSTRRKWDENPSKSNQLSHVQSHVPTVRSWLDPIGSNVLPKMEGTVSMERPLHIELFDEICYKSRHVNSSVMKLFHRFRIFVAIKILCVYPSFCFVIISAALKICSKICANFSNIIKFFIWFTFYVSGKREALWNRL